ncbi:MAG: M16 family metallopeptidase [Acidimicrobiia bacterium]
MSYDLTTLPGGLRVITEEMTGVRSVAIGCWIDTGTRDELPNEAGASHFLEHLLFKGSKSLSAQEISEAFDSMGAQANAFTSKEQTCFWARLLDDDLPRGMKLLAEMLRRPAFRPDEIDSERKVVIEEINMNEDDPSDTAHEQFLEALFEGHSLAHPVLGTRDSITSMGRDDLSNYWQRRYNASSTVIALAGSLQHDDVVTLVGELFEGWEGGDVPHDIGDVPVMPKVRLTERDTEQANVVVGGRGLTRDDPRRFADAVMSHILGGGMSSRLFRKIREEKGLAYAVFSFGIRFADTGGWGVFVGTTPGLTSTALGLISEELDLMEADGVSEEELTRAKGALKGSMAISLEDANSRMTRLGRAEVSGVEHLSTEERIARVEAVTESDVAEVAEQLLTGPRVIGAVGPLTLEQLEEHLT